MRFSKFHHLKITARTGTNLEQRNKSMQKNYNGKIHTTHRSVRWICGDSLNYGGRVTHRCVNNLTIIDSDNGLSPGRHQSIIWANAQILLTGPLGTNFSEIMIEINTFLFTKMHLEMSSGKWQPFWCGLNELNELVFLWILLCIWTNVTVWQVAFRKFAHILSHAH